MKEANLEFNMQKSLALYYLYEKSYEGLKLSDYVSFWFQQKVSNFKILVGSYSLDMIKSSYFSMIRYPLYSN